MSQTLFIVGAFVTGGFVTTYLAANSLVSERVGSDLQANLPYFLLGFAVTLVIFLAKGNGFGDFSKYTEVPWWAFLAGIGGGLGVWVTTLLIGEIGADKFFVASVAGQLLISALLAHFGWLGNDENPITWVKVVGLVLAFGGAAMVTLVGSGEG